MARKAFQDQTPSNNCWGCGPNNEEGLQIKSYWNEEVEGETILHWTPAPYHKAGPDHILNGGIISTIIDCHSIFTAVAQAAKDEGVPISNEIWYVTGTLKVVYLNPTPIDQPVELHARVIEAKRKKSKITCSLISNGIETVQGESIGIRVPNEWRDRSSH